MQTYFNYICILYVSQIITSYIKSINTGFSGQFFFYPNSCTHHFLFVKPNKWYFAYFLFINVIRPFCVKQFTISIRTFHVEADNDDLNIFKDLCSTELVYIHIYMLM